MSFIKKTRPTDGAEEEKENLTDEEEMENFLKQAEEDRKEREEENKKRADELRKEREGSKDRDDEEAEEERRVGLRIEPKKRYVMKKGSGIFDRKNKNISYGTEKFDKNVEKKFKNGARRVSLEKKEEFMQLFDRYHKFKRSSLSTVNKDELIKFEAGLRRGNSDEKFDKLCKELKNDGVIKNSAEVKKFFTKRELKMMRNSLTGQEDNQRYRRTDVRGSQNTSKTSRPSRPITPMGR